MIAQLDLQYLSVISDTVTTILKIGLPLAYALGLFAISSYLSNFGAPLLMSDLSTTLWFINVAALITFGAIILAATVFFVPAFFLSTSSRSLRYTRTTPPRSFLSPLAQQKEFVIQWFTNNGIAFTALVACTILNFVKISSATLVIVPVCLMSMVLCLILITGYLLHCYSWFYKRMLETKPTTTPIKILAALSVRVLRHSLAKTAWTFVWALAVFNLINAFGNLVKPTAIWFNLIDIRYILGIFYGYENYKRDIFPSSSIHGYGVFRIFYDRF